MYCRKCGAEIKETSKFCDSCGCEVVKVKQVSYAEKYNENKKKNKNQTQSLKEQERMMKHKDEKNPYIAASLVATVVALVLAMFPWNLLGSGIGTSLPMRIVVVVFALLYAFFKGVKIKWVFCFLKRFLDQQFGVIQK